MAKRKSSAESKVSKRKSEIEMTEGIQSVQPKEASGFSGKWRLIGVAVLVLLVFYFKHRTSPQSDSVTAISTTAQPEWGPELKLEVLSKFDAPDGVFDLKVDAKGDVYVLTATSLERFTGGKMQKALQFGTAAPVRSMAFDGKNFYITDFGDAIIVKVDTSLANPKVFNVTKASRLLGIAASQKTGDIFASEVSGKAVHVLDAAGRVKRRISGPVKKDAADGFFIDLQLSDDGSVLQSDQYGSSINKMRLDGKVFKFPKVPWSPGSAIFERAAIIGNKIYMNCFKDQRVVVMNMAGDPIGYVKKESPQAITAGLDGFLYLKTGGSIQKLKLLDASVNTPVKVVVSPMALTQTKK